MIKRVKACSGGVWGDAERGWFSGFGYPDWRSDIGRNAISALLDGRVIRFGVEGSQRLSHRDLAKINRAFMMRIFGFVRLMAALKAPQ